MSSSGPASSSAAAVPASARTPSEAALCAGSARAALEGHAKAVTALSWGGAGGTRLASGGKDRAVRLWDVARGTAAELRGHDEAVAGVAWRPGSDAVLASTAPDSSVRVWDGRVSGDGRVSAAQVVAVAGENLAVRWSPDGLLLAVLDTVDMLTLVDARTLKVACRRRLAGRVVEQLAFAADSKHLLLARENGSLEVHDVARLGAQAAGSPPPETMVASVAAHVSVCYDVCAHPAGRRMATCGADGMAAVWDARELACTATVDRHQAAVRSVSLSGDASLLASAAGAPLVDVARADTGRLLFSLPAAAPVQLVAFCQTAPLLAYAGDERRPARSGRGDTAPINVFGALS